MTEERMALIELIEKGADGGLVRERPAGWLAFAAERMMALEIEAKTGRRGRRRALTQPPEPPQQPVPGPDPITR